MTISDIVEQNELTRDITADEFNKLNIHDKVKFINENIPKFKSGSNICKKLGVSIDAFRGQIKNIYTYLPLYQAYVKIEDLEQGLKHVSDNTSDDITVVDAHEPTQSFSSPISLSNIENAQEKLALLLNNYDTILNLVENAHEPTQSIHSNINTSMNLNMPDAPLKKTTIRVNEDICNSFKSCIESEFFRE